MVAIWNDSNAANRNRTDRIFTDYTLNLIGNGVPACYIDCGRNVLVVCNRAVQGAICRTISAVSIVFADINAKAGCKRGCRGTIKKLSRYTCDVFVYAVVIHVTRLRGDSNLVGKRITWWIEVGFHTVNQ